MVDITYAMVSCVILIFGNERASFNYFALKGYGNSIAMEVRSTLALSDLEMCEYPGVLRLNHECSCVHAPWGVYNISYCCC